MRLLLLAALLVTPALANAEDAERCVIRPAVYVTDIELPGGTTCVPSPI